MKVRVAQCLCPRRHAIVGLVLNDPDTTDQEILTMLHQTVQALLSGKGASVLPGLPNNVNPRCGLCGSPHRDWLFEVRWSKEFDTWEQAQVVFKDFEDAQQLLRSVAEVLGVSYDARQKRSMN